MDYKETNEFFLFITKVIKLNTVPVEGGYMSGIPVKTSTNQNSLVVQVFSPLGENPVKAPFREITVMSLCG